MVCPSTEPRSCRPCRKPARQLVPGGGPGSRTPALGRVPRGCAVVRSGTASRLRVSATLHPAVPYHMVISLSRSYADFLPCREAERCASAAAGSGSGADAGGSRLQAVVRLGLSPSPLTPWLC